MTKGSQHTSKLFIACLVMGAHVGVAQAQQPGAPAPDPAQESTNSDVGADGVTRPTYSVTRVTPDGLPNRTLKPQSYDRISRPTRLPSPPSRDELSALETMLTGKVVRVIALVMPPRPYRQVPMVYEGHAVWMSQKKDASAPVLVSTLNWLEGAQTIYLAPLPKTPTSSGTLQRSRIVKLSDLNTTNAGARTLRHIKANPKLYTALTRVSADRQRNLVQLKGVAKPQRLPKGLTTFDAGATPLSYAYGYSPGPTAGLQNAAVLGGQAPQESLQYYLQNTYAGILGAPVVSLQGEVIGLNAMRNPTQATVSLAVPHQALRDFVKQRQGIKDEKKEDATP